jgi:hypothetical protein
MDFLIITTPRHLPSFHYQASASPSACIVYLLKFINIPDCNMATRGLPPVTSVISLVVFSKLFACRISHAESESNSTQTHAFR